MGNKNTRYIEKKVFKSIIEHTPIVAVDVIVKHEKKILLGKRINKPAQDYWFTFGGRVVKNEMIHSAIVRIAHVELGVALISTPKFIGVFEHFYDESIFDDVPIHYLDLAYEVEISVCKDFQGCQHSEYRWFNLKELMKSKEVHDYVKDYFRKQKGTIPQI